MNKKDKICFISPSLQLGGLENAAALMANYLESQNKEVTFITLYNFKSFYSLNTNIQLIKPNRDKNNKNKFFYYFHIIRYLRQNIKEINPSSVVTYGDWSNILVLLAAYGLKTKIFISDRASPGLQFQWYVSLLRKILYPRAYGIIAQTERAAQQKRNMLGNNINIKVIPNPIKKIRLFPDIKRKNVILGIGRHWQVKGFDRLIEAIAMTDLKGYELWIAGSEGPATKSMEALIKKHHLGESVKLLGSIKEVDRLSASCKIFVLPSRSEGFPNALIESMAAGLACISFDVNAGPREIITPEKDGILIEDGNIQAMAKEIQRLIDNKHLIEDLGENALKIRERLSLEKIGLEYMNFILN